MNSKKPTSFLLLTGFLLSGSLAVEGIIEKLGMEHRNAQYYITGNLLGTFRNGEVEEDNGADDQQSVYAQAESFKLPYARLLPAVIAGDKTGAARELCDYVKQYVNSQDFADEYNKKRLAAKPTSEPWRPEADMIKSQRENVKEMEKQVADMKKNKQMPATTIDAMEKSLTDQKRQLALWEDPHPNLTRWEKLYPEDPAPLLRSKLQEYLALVATVDFNAPLTAPDKYKIKKFVNPAYEKQTLKWKACFRAGKNVNDVVTAFVKDWLKGDIISKEKTKMPDFRSVPAEQTSKPAPVLTPAPPVNVDSVPKPAKEKKSLLNKLKKATGF